MHTEEQQQQNPNEFTEAKILEDHDFSERNHIRHHPTRSIPKLNILDPYSDPIKSKKNRFRQHIKTPDVPIQSKEDYINENLGSLTNSARNIKESN